MTPFQLGLGSGQAVAFGRDGEHDTLSALFEDMEGENLMRHIAKNGADRLGIEGRAIGGDTLEHQRAIRQRRLQPSQKGVMSS